MDGLKCVVPDSCKEEEPTQLDLFGALQEKRPCPACQNNTLRGHTGQYCLVKDWFAKDKDGKLGKKIKYVDLITKKQ